jgi:hypothetical protein
MGGWLLMGKDGQSQNIEKKGDDDAVSRIWRKGQKEKKKEADRVGLG